MLFTPKKTSEQETHIRIVRPSKEKDHRVSSRLLVGWVEKIP
jgi:hypothetical protein